MPTVDPAVPASASAPEPTADRRFYLAIAVVSALALGALAWLLLIREGDATASVNLRFMPAVNAGLNSVAAVLLTSGWLAIRRGNRKLHQHLMASAFAASTLFLAGYVAYHFVHGDTRFGGEGLLRTFYLSILATHVLLSMFVVPLALVTLFFAWRKSFTRHRRVARVLLPMWLYVSVTGVVIFFMLRSSLPASP